MNAPTTYGYDLTSATLVRKSAGGVDCFEGLAEFVGDGGRRR